MAKKAIATAPAPAGVVGEVTVARVERAAHELRLTLDAAGNTLGAYDGEIAPIRDRYAPLIRRHGADIKAGKEALEGLLAAAKPGLFGRVKSKVIHGIKVGWRKTADAWAWPEESALVALIKKHCTAEQQETFLKTTTVGLKDAIPEAVRTTLGIGCTRGTDAPVVNETAPSTGAALLALLAQLPEPEPGHGQD